MNKTGNSGKREEFRRIAKNTNLDDILIVDPRSELRHQSDSKEIDGICPTDSSDNKD